MPKIKIIGLPKMQNAGQCPDGYVYDPVLQECVPDIGTPPATVSVQEPPPATSQVSTDGDMNMTIFQEPQKFNVSRTLSTGTPKTGPGTGVNPSQQTNDWRKNIKRANIAFGALLNLGSGLARIKENERIKKEFEKAFRESNFSGPIKQGKDLGNVQTNTGVQFPNLMTPPNEGMFITQFGGDVMGKYDQEKVKIRIESAPNQMKFGGQSGYGLDLGWRKFYTDMSKTTADNYTDSMSEDKSADAPFPVIEAEGGETFIRPEEDGSVSFFKLNGKRHSEGGIPLNEEQVSSGIPGVPSFMFSDTPKLKIKNAEILEAFGIPKKLWKKGVTPAEISKKFPLNQWNAILKDINSDDYQKSTAQKMINKNTKMLAKLGMIQEAMKNEQPPVFAQQRLAQGQVKYGGPLPKYQGVKGSGQIDPSLGSNQGFKKIAQTPGRLDYNEIAANYNVGFWDTPENYTNNWIPKVNQAFSDPERAKQLISRLETYTGQDAPDVLKIIRRGKTLDEKIKIAKKLATDRKIGPYHAIVAAVIDQTIPPPTREKPFEPNITVGGKPEPGALPKNVIRYVCKPDPSKPGKFIGTPIEVTEGAEGFKTAAEAEAFCNSRGADVPFGYTAPDVYNMFASSAIPPRTIFPFVPTPQLETPSVALEDWRARTANRFATMYAAPAQTLATYGPTQGLGSVLSKLAGQTAQAQAQDMAQVIGTNVNRANQAFAQAAEVRNKQRMLEAQAAEKRYTGMATALQQSDNAWRAYLKDFGKAFDRAWDRRQALGDINATNVHFFKDPWTGKQIFKPNTAGFAGLASSSTGISGANLGSLYNAYYTQALNELKKNADMTDEQKKKAAADLANLEIRSLRQTQRYDKYGNPIGRTSIYYGDDDEID